MDFHMNGFTYFIQGRAKVGLHCEYAKHSLFLY